MWPPAIVHRPALPLSLSPHARALCARKGGAVCFRAQLIDPFHSLALQQKCILLVFAVGRPRRPELRNFNPGLKRIRETDEICVFFCVFV